MRSAGGPSSSSTVGRSSGRSPSAPARPRSTGANTSAGSSLTARSS